MASLMIDPQAAADAADDEGRSLAETLAVLRRRRGLMAAVFGALLLLAVAVALLLPAVYRSTATILIKEQEIPQEFVRSTVTSFADERIQVISQQVMTRATLLDLVERYNLYASARRRETSEEILERMRRDIRLTPISAEVTDRRTGAPGKATIAFTLAYDSEEPAAAQKIANELTTLFLNENVKNRQQKAAETTSFLDEELERLGTHIGELEQNLADFKRRHQGSTPELSLNNQMGIERTEFDLQRAERDHAMAADRLRSLQRQLLDTKPNAPLQSGGTTVPDPDERLRTLQVQLTALSAQYSDDHPDVRRVRREIALLQGDAATTAPAADRAQALAAQQAELAQLRQRYGEDHPDVQRLRRSVAALQTIDTSATPPATAASAAARERRPDNPAYVALKAQVEGAQSLLTSLDSERRELRQRLGALSARVAQSPEVEREALDLARDLDTSRQRFRELRSKQMQAEVAEQLERSRKAERFAIIEPPIYPERPVRPNRPLILALGALGALVGAFAAALLAHAVAGTVEHPKDLVRALQVPVLAVLPALPATPSHRRRALAAAAAATAVAVLLALVAVHWLWLPLDVAGFSLLRRLGL